MSSGGGGGHSDPTWFPALPTEVPRPAVQGAIPIPGSEHWSEDQWVVHKQTLLFAASMVLMEARRGRTAAEAGNRIIAAAEGRQL